VIILSKLKTIKLPLIFLLTFVLLTGQNTGKDKFRQLKTQNLSVE